LLDQLFIALQEAPEDGVSRPPPILHLPRPLGALGLAASAVAEQLHLRQHEVVGGLPMEATGPGGGSGGRPQWAPPAATGPDGVGGGGPPWVQPAASGGVGGGEERPPWPPLVANGGGG
uniref:Uncharacterized protein n=1 Tax=Amphimedon queenslandica TaxID=400682 RepID=A0A1X7UBL2_AMPQE